MNERIKKLLEKATVVTYRGPMLGDVANVDQEKFAELIVVGCAEFAVKQQAERDVRNIVSDNPARDFALGVIKHFGVK